MARTHLIAGLLSFSLLSGLAHAHGRTVAARVTAVEPIYESVVIERPVTSCHREVTARRVPRRNTAATAVAGAIVGAAVGRQFGDGTGRDALTVIGAVAGSAIASEHATRRYRERTAYRVVREPVERCTTRYQRRVERRLTGYQVEYAYRGRYYRIRTAERPGRYIHVVYRS